MAYTPKTWECGETITADALNHIEQGIAQSGGGSEPLIVRYDHEETTDDVTKRYYDKTWQEVKDAFDAGRTVYLYVDDGMRVFLVGVREASDSPIPLPAEATFTSGASSARYLADSADGYLYREKQSGSVQ